MKNKILKFSLILIIVIYTNFSNAQIIVDMAEIPTFQNIKNGYSGCYIKDVNNHLDNFTGTWEYVNGNKKFQIVLTKVTKYHYPRGNFYTDGIKIQYRKYKNDVLIEESSLPNAPMFVARNGITLKGIMYDVESENSSFLRNVQYSNIDIFYNCYIKKQLKSTKNQQSKIYFRLNDNGLSQFPYKEKNDSVLFPIPNDVIMTKVD